MSFMAHPDAMLFLPFIYAGLKKGKTNEYRLETRGIPPEYVSRALAMEIECPNPHCAQEDTLVHPFKRRKYRQARSPKAASKGSVYLAVTGEHAEVCSKGDGASAEYVAIVAALKKYHPQNVRRSLEPRKAVEVLAEMYEEGLELRDSVTGFTFSLGQVLNLYT